MYEPSDEKIFEVDKSQLRKSSVPLVVNDGRKSILTNDSMNENDFEIKSESNSKPNLAENMLSSVFHDSKK